MTSHQALAIRLAVVALAAALAAPVLVQAQSFGVQIHSLVPYSAPGGTAASIYTQAGDCRLVVCAEALSFETGFLANVASASASMGALGGAASGRASSTNTSAGSDAFSNIAWVGFNINTRDDIVLRIQDTTQSGPPHARLLSTVLHLQVGQTYTLQQSLEISALGNLAWTGLSGFTPQSWAMDVSADHTSLAFIDVLGDATLLAASGQNDASAVPEPGTALMFLTGLLSTGLVARRRLPR